MFVRRLSRNVALRRPLVVLVVFSIVTGMLILPQRFARFLPVANAAVSIPTATTTSQNFDGMGVPATAATASTLPIDFRADALTAVRTVGTFSSAGTSAARAGGASLSTTASNGIYNFGSGTTALGGADRALGFLASGSATTSGNLYAQLANNTGGNLAGLEISYDVEKYRGGSNSAGFRIQLFYSTDGATWTSAGSNFLTAFAADATNSGFATAPGATVPVSSTLNVAVPNNGNFYLAWNYSVTSGTTVTNAQALAVDNVTIKGVGGVSPTNPAGTGAANPTSVAPTETTLLTVAVTPGSNPASTAHTVSANLSSIGGSGTQNFFDDGTNGDASAGDNVFSYLATIAAGTAGGGKTLPFTITETAPNARVGGGNISLTVLASTSPTGTGSANPSSVLPGATSQLSVSVTPGTNPASTGIAVTADLSSIGLSATQAFAGSGNVFTYSATVPSGTTPGPKTLPVSITDSQGRIGSTSIALNVDAPPLPLDHIVISQVYGGGGNGNVTTPAPYHNDFVELYNPTTAAVDVGGWSVQYASATGTTWQVQPLGGVIQPGEYYLIALASGGSFGAPLPPANIDGSINMSATAGKVALARNGDAFSGCPFGTDPNLVDLVGFGTTSAVCREGSTNAPAGSNTTSIFRKDSGATDTDVNGSDFVAGTPSPRRTAVISEIGPYVLSVDPRANSSSAPHDDSVTVTFTEAVDVNDGWFAINCATTGAHNSATVAHTSDSRTFVITPNVNFQFGEQCTATVFQNGVHDQDTDDGEPGTDTLKADFTWSFSVVAAGEPAPYPASVHLTMGNPSCNTSDGCATPDPTHPNNYLMEKDAYTLSYNRDKGTPNWVSWHLEPRWYGSLPRVDTFRPDPAVPSQWYRVEAFDYFSSGFDRGHMTPNADRDYQNSTPLNQETFLMSNMVPQAPDNNQGPWADLEGELRSIADAGNELYIVAGPAGVGGTGSNGGVSTSIASGHITVPAYTWKVALVLPKQDGDDVARVNCSTRAIAVIMPNVQGIRNNDWHQYLTTVDAVEQLSGYDILSNLPLNIQACVEANTDGVNDPPTANPQSVSTNEDTALGIALSGSDVDSPTLTYSVVTGPAHGTLTGSAPNLTYAPAGNYNGPDSFTFWANDGTFNSQPATVSITVNAVNDVPTADAQMVSTDEDTAKAIQLSGSDLETASGSLTFAVTQGPQHGALSGTAPSVTYTPAANYNGPDSFKFTVTDTGDGAAPAVTSTEATVSITVAPVNDAPVANADAAQVNEDAQVTVSVLSNDTDVDGDTLTVSSASNGTHGTAVRNANNTITYSPAANYFGTDSFTYSISDGRGGTAGATVNVTVSPVNDAPAASSDVPSQSVQYSDAMQNVTVTGTDIDSSSLTASTAYTKNGGASQAGLPANLALSAATCTLQGIGTSCTWTISGRVDLEPATYVVTVGVGDGSLQTTTAVTLIVAREDARADYTGAQFVSTSSTSSNTATVTLGATVRDITALCDPGVDPACDQLAGDIANSTVTFVNRDNGTVLAANVPLGYVTAGDTKTATATTNVTLSTGTADSASFTIGIVVGGRYARDSDADDTVVTVSKPTSGIISGGGNLVLTNSAGKRAGDAGSKNNFGFNIRNDRNGPKGNINVLVRRTETDGILHTYQIKGNAMTSLSSSVAAGIATFNGKGNIQDITFANDPVNPRVISIDGNATLQVTMTDGGSAGPDTIGITLWDKSGGLWFASKWDGVKTVEHTLSGGNLQVR